MIDRRYFLAIGGAALVQGCAGGPATLSGSALSGARTDPATRVAANPAWDAWVAAFKPRARAQGIREDVITRAFNGAGFLPGVIDLDRNQTEFKRSFEDYLALVANDEKITAGRAAFARHRRSLDAIEAKIGVPAQVMAAVWGVESNYGRKLGQIPVISATSTLAWEGRRGRFFENQLLGALKILQSGDTMVDKMTGSWAGAMGHTQLIPTTYLEYAVDFTGDGRRDIWASDPTDALASTASYLARFGWQRGQSWGGEVGSRGAVSGGRILQPDPGGPRFAVGRNFTAIKRYNPSDNYALAVGYLSDRIAGGGPLRQPFGPDKFGLTLEQRKLLQSRLNAKGYDAGTADGVYGRKSRAAVTAFQRSIGVTATGDPSPALLTRLG